MPMIGLFYSDFSSVAIDQRASVILSILALCGMFSSSLCCYALILVLCRAASSSFLCSFLCCFRCCFLCFFLPLHRMQSSSTGRTGLLTLSLCLCLCSLPLTFSSHTHTFSLPHNTLILFITFSRLGSIDRVNRVLHKRGRLREFWSVTHTHTHTRAHMVYRGRIEDRTLTAKASTIMHDIPNSKPRPLASILDLKRLEYVIPTL
jgi:hypothetical protein